MTAGGLKHNTSCKLLLITRNVKEGHDCLQTNTMQKCVNIIGGFIEFIIKLFVLIIIILPSKFDLVVLNTLFYFSITTVIKIY